jgi:hypothetical protein
MYLLGGFIKYSGFNQMGYVKKSHGILKGKISENSLEVATFMTN